MGGRGASSYSAVASSPAATKRTAAVQTGHLTDAEIPDTPEKTAAYLGTDVDTAKRLYNSVNAFTGSAYVGIHRWQSGDEYYSEYKHYADDLEKYIGLAPKWGGGTTYRGISVSQETAVQLLGGKRGRVGKIVDVNHGTASWSTYLGTAEKFAKGNEVNLVFVSKTQNAGTSIRHISQFKNEGEVLVSKDVRYRITSKPKKRSGYILVEVEEC